MFKGKSIILVLGVVIGLSDATACGLKRKIQLGKFSTNLKVAQGTSSLEGMSLMLTCQGKHKRILEKKSLDLEVEFIDFPIDEFQTRFEVNYYDNKVLENPFKFPKYTSRSCFGNFNVRLNDSHALPEIEGQEIVSDVNLRIENKNFFTKNVEKVLENLLIKPEYETITLGCPDYHKALLLVRSPEGQQMDFSPCLYRFRAIAAKDGEILAKGQYSKNIKIVQN